MKQFLEDSLITVHNQEHSEKVQQALFGLGIGWENTGKNLFKDEELQFHLQIIITRTRSNSEELFMLQGAYRNDLFKNIDMDYLNPVKTKKVAVWNWVYPVCDGWNTEYYVTDEKLTKEEVKAEYAVVLSKINESKEYKLVEYV